MSQWPAGKIGTKLLHSFKIVVDYSFRYDIVVLSY
jgi:hypothetical protein